MTAVAAGRFVAHLFTSDPLSVPSPPAVSVCTVGTSTLSNLYTDKSTGTAAANPVAVDASGSVSFFAAPGDYDLVWTDGDVEGRLTVTVRPDPANPLVTEGTKISAGTGVPTIAGALGDLFVRTDGGGTAIENIYSCTTAGAANAAVWTGIA